MSNINDPFSDLALDKEEQLLETTLEEGGFKEVSDLEDTTCVYPDAKTCIAFVPEVSHYIDANFISGLYTVTYRHTGDLAGGKTRRI